MRKRFEMAYAQVVLKSEIELKKNGEVETSKGHCFADSGSVYDFLIDNFEHDIAVEAESWTELATIGDFYENEYLEIEMIEE